MFFKKITLVLNLVSGYRDTAGQLLNLGSRYAYPDTLINLVTIMIYSCLIDLDLQALFIKFLILNLRVLVLRSTCRYSCKFSTGMGS
eukprot:SAG31_NODE_3112_length_4661_cov_9.186760_2_plen_87_part_00